MQSAVLQHECHALFLQFSFPHRYAIFSLADLAPARLDG
jgi:hypothetical protein